MMIGQRGAILCEKKWGSSNGVKSFLIFFRINLIEELTHQEEPQKITREDLPIEARCEKEIKVEKIKAFYKEIYEANG